MLRQLEQTCRWEEGASEQPVEANRKLSWHLHCLAHLNLHQQKQPGAINCRPGTLLALWVWMDFNAWTGSSKVWSIGLVLFWTTLCECFEGNCCAPCLSDVFGLVVVSAWAVYCEGFVGKSCVPCFWDVLRILGLSLFWSKYSAPLRYVFVSPVIYLGFVKVSFSLLTQCPWEGGSAWGCAFTVFWSGFSCGVVACLGQLGWFPAPHPAVPFSLLPSFSWEPASRRARLWLPGPGPQPPALARPREWGRPSYHCTGLTLWCFIVSKGGIEDVLRKTYYTARLGQIFLISPDRIRQEISFSPLP